MINLKKPAQTLILLMVYFLCQTAFAREVPGPLVSTDWLADHINDPGTVLIEVTQHPDLYTDGGHVPGARLWDVKAETKFIDLKGKSQPIPSMDQVNALMRRFGVNDDSAIIISTPGITADDATFGTRAVVVLKYFGHNNVALLDGGTSKWASEERVLSKKIPQKTRAGYFTSKKPSSDYLVSTDYVKSHLNDKMIQIIDVRKPEIYQGNKKQPFVKEYGHIPGAKNWVIYDFFTTTPTINKKFPQYVTYLTEQKLKASAIKHNLDLAKPSLFYCSTGHLSSGGFFAFHELLKLQNSKFYIASLKQWADHKLPTVINK